MLSWMAPRSVLLPVLFGPAFFTAICGCGEPEGAKVVPVQGRVIVDGKPASSALITLHPIAGGGDARPTARAAVDGAFALTTRDSGDGAPPGEYRVTVTWTSVVAGKRPSDSDDVAIRNLLSPTYSRPETTPLRATVKPGTNEPLTIDIKTGRR